MPLTGAPRVSIGLSVYNGERFLKETLDSILAQTYKNFELIITDNASTDSTDAICRKYAALDSRICYSRNAANIGLYGNYNRAFRLATGTYFRWSAADDLFEPTSLEACVDVLDHHPEVVLCYPQTVLIDGNGEFLRHYEENLDIRSTAAPDRFRLLLENLRLVNVIYGLMRADVIRRTPLFGNYPGADLVFLAELALHGQFREIPQRLFLRRMHEAASSALKDKPWDTSQMFWNTPKADEVDLYYLTLRYYNLISIFRVPMRVVDKVRSMFALAGYTFRSRHTHLKELQCAGGTLLKRATAERHK